MPLKRPNTNAIKPTIKKKLGLKTTFEEKRKALGIERTREFNTTTKLQGQANPKIRAAEGSLKKASGTLETKINSLLSKKPKNELEARKLEEDISNLKEKLREEILKKKNAVYLINSKRNQDRNARQSKIIANKLVSILSPVDKIMLKARLSEGVLDFNTVSSNYRYLLKIRNKTFAEVTSKEALDILERSIQVIRK